MLNPVKGKNRIKEHGTRISAAFSRAASKSCRNCTAIPKTELSAFTFHKEIVRIAAFQTAPNRTPP